MRTTFKVLFYVNRNKEREGLVPVLCRITLCGTISQFSCHLKVPLRLWDPKEGKVHGKSATAASANSVLEGIRARIIMIYHELAIQGRAHTASQVRDMFFGRGTESRTLLQMLDRQNGIIASRVGKDRSLATLNKYKIVRRHAAEYICRSMHAKDVPLEALDESFIRGFCLYLRKEVGLSQSSVWVYQMPLRTVATAAFNDGIIQRNPFVNFHVSPEVKQRNFLSESQLRCLIAHPFSGSLDFVRDIFVFSCFTGLSFIDLKNLKSSDLVEFNGGRWIVSHRQKTKVNFQAKLLGVPLRLLDKYGPVQDGSPVFKIGSYSNVNKQLKLVGRASGVSGNLTFHCARHTFATLALSKGMSMESLRSILGHTDIHTTQLYAKITSSKLESDYQHLTAGLGDI